MRTIKFRGVHKGVLLPPESLTQSPIYRQWLGKLDVELMQYTGLKDKNGKEVYEGDVDSLGRVVVFKDGAYHFEYYNQTTQSDVLTQKRCDYIEIIGNIHEHPELLGDKTEV